MWRGGGSRKKGVVENCEKIGAREVEVLCRASVCVEGCTCNFQTFGKCVCVYRRGGGGRTKRDRGGLEGRGEEAKQTWRREPLSPSLPHPAVKITQSEGVNHSCDARVYAH